MTTIALLCLIIAQDCFTILLCRFTNNILSTAQQVWLQKFGGAKSPALKLSDDTSRKEQRGGAKIPTLKLSDKTSREEQPQIQKQVSEATITKKKDENPTSDRPRQGDRLERLVDLVWR